MSNLIPCKSRLLQFEHGPFCLYQPFGLCVSCVSSCMMLWFSKRAMWVVRIMRIILFDAMNLEESDVVCGYHRVQCYDSRREQWGLRVSILLNAMILEESNVSRCYNWWKTYTNWRVVCSIKPSVKSFGYSTSLAKLHWAGGLGTANLFYEAPLQRSNHFGLVLWLWMEMEWSETKNLNWGRSETKLQQGRTLQSYLLKRLCIGIQSLEWILTFRRDISFSQNSISRPDLWQLSSSRNKSKCNKGAKFHTSTHALAISTINRVAGLLWEPSD